MWAIHVNLYMPILILHLLIIWWVVEIMPKSYPIWWLSNLIKWNIIFYLSEFGAMPRRTIKHLNNPDVISLSSSNALDVWWRHTYSSPFLSLVCAPFTWPQSGRSLVLIWMSATLTFLFLTVLSGSVHSLNVRYLSSQYPASPFYSTNITAQTIYTVLDCRWYDSLVPPCHTRHWSLTPDILRVLIGAANPGDNTHRW